MKKLKLIIAAVVIAIIQPALVNAHCQVPCGIYGDDARFDAMFEDTATIEKSMRSIAKLESDAGKNINQLIRWVDTKELHADKLTEIVTAYFLTQRIKPVGAADKDAHDAYLKKLELLHNIMIQTMKCKQTTDVEHVEKLRMYITQFRVVYSAK
jgi:hypothetical protein